MLFKLLPEFFKQAIKPRTRTITDSGLYVQSFPGEDAYCIKPGNRTAKLPEGEKLPIPPKGLWLGYGPDAHAYVSGGERHVTDMIRLLEEEGFSLEVRKGF